MSVGLSALSETPLAAPEPAKESVKVPRKRVLNAMKDDRLAAEAR